MFDSLYRDTNLVNVNILNSIFWIRTLTFGSSVSWRARGREARQLQWPLHHPSDLLLLQGADSALPIIWQIKDSAIVRPGWKIAWNPRFWIPTLPIFYWLKHKTRVVKLYLLNASVGLFLLWVIPNPPIIIGLTMTKIIIKTWHYNITLAAKWVFLIKRNIIYDYLFANNTFFNEKSCRVVHHFAIEMAFSKIKRFA